MFSQEIETFAQYESIRKELTEINLSLEIKALKVQYDAAVKAKRYSDALIAISKIEPKNNEYYESSGTYLIEQTTLHDMFLASSQQVLKSEAKDTLDISQVSAVYVKTGMTYDDGKKTSVIPAGSPFGINLSGVLTTNNIQSKWYLRYIQYAQAIVLETLISEGKPANHGSAWYEWFGDTTGFSPGFYVVVLVGLDSNNTEYNIGRLHFEVR